MKELKLNHILCLFMVILVANLIVVSFMLFEIRGLRADLAAMEPVEIEIVAAPETASNEDNNLIEMVSEEPVTEVIDAYVAYSSAPPTVYFDVPLSEDLQDHLFEVCEHYDVSPELVIGMIDTESKFDPNAENRGARGLMQVVPKWHIDRMARLGCSDMYDPYQNITVGVDYISELIGRGKGLEWALMAYNGGPSYANKKVAAGKVTGYASGILNLADNYRRA